MNDFSIKTKIAEYSSRLYKKGLIGAADCNISVKAGDNEILITCSGTPKGFLSENDIVSIDLSGKQISGTKKPSSEYLMHLLVYNKRPYISACVHAHPPYLTALSTVGIVPPVSLLPEAVLTIGDIALIPYARVGTKELPRQLDPFITDYSTFVLKNHGVLTIAASLEEAHNMMETVEHLAKIFYIAKNCGEPDLLIADEITRLRNQNIR